MEFQGAAGELSHLAKTLLTARLFTVSEQVRCHSNPAAKFRVRPLAIADGAFRRCQAAILQGLEHGRFRGGDACKFKEFVRPVGKAVISKPFVMVTGIRQGRGVNASPATDVTVRV